MSLDLITLADLPDLPELAAGETPTSTIIVARLGEYQDPRYGSFGITQDDVDGWKRNLSDTFGGKVAIDVDHSSDRGRGTEAAGWITSLHLDGNDVKAGVEWTPKGAAAIRDRSYQYVSPTFVNSYKNEYGEDRGRALIGAALTNRPVLRQLPTLSLSADSFEGVATPRTPRTTTTTAEGVSVAVLVEKTEAINRYLLAAGLLAKEARTLSSGMAPALLDHWQQPTARYARTANGVEYALAQPPANAAEEFARAEGLTDEMAARVDPDRANLDAAARRMAASSGMDYASCAAMLAEQSEVVEPLAAVDGSNALEYLDSSAPRPVSPYAGKDADGKWTQPREELFQRDLRRAGAAGVTDLDRDMYDAYAEQGRDLAFELAQGVRETRLAGARANVETMLETAKTSAAKQQQRAADAKALESQRVSHAKARRAHEDELQHGSDRFVGW